MFDVAEQVRDWLHAGLDPTVATVVATRGFSSREPGAAAAWLDVSAPVGRLLDGVLPAAVHGQGIVQVAISEQDAIAAGLACGGVASVLALPASAYPDGTWQRLVDREPTCLVATDEGVRMFTPESVRNADGSGSVADVSRLFARGVTTTLLLEQPRAAVLALWPVPTLVVVGDGLLATALRDAAGLLGWSARDVQAAAEAEVVIGTLHACDAVIVLSHDRAVDGPALAAALGGRVGYVGALGSRRTQAARGEWLAEHGVAENDRARIHGPAGLDIGAHSPGEIAVSIVAEILAVRAGTTGGTLRERRGPVHATGVQAPPPRY